MFMKAVAMERYYLKSFIVVAEEQYLTREAAPLHISQPRLSTHLETLVEELGLNLFIRTPKRMILSNKGKPIKLKAELAMQAVEDVPLQADHLNQKITGMARIGLNLDDRHLKASDLLSELRCEFLDSELHNFQRFSLEARGQILTFINLDER